MRKSLEALLPWVNSAGDWPANKELRQFVAEFDGSADSGFIEAAVEPWQPRRQIGLENWTKDDDVRHIHTVVEAILQQGFNDSESLVVQIGGAAPLPSLAFGVRGARSLPKNRKARRAHFAAPGSYVMQVRGQLRDLIPFLVLHTLTSPGAARLARCPAPRPRDAERQCGQFFLTGGKGQPKKFCSDACRVRAYWKRK